ncbi:hypothetical protein BMETH_1335_0 [methanotrophic bacterial endosymbiont of Bathymodiolus sp.]|nr:hypothetical protein BMETH_1335_0 [methanotrophic bacterial endosymbiont of Bathymodiolus sp.]
MTPSFFNRPATCSGLQSSSMWALIMHLISSVNLTSLGLFL